MKKTTRLFAIAALTALITGCGGPNEFKPTAGMPAADIFSSACASCHGEKGTGKFGFLLKIAGSEDAAEEIANKIKEGGMLMPSFPNVNDEERLAVAAYVKSL